VNSTTLRPPRPGLALAISGDGFTHALLIPEGNALPCTAQAIGKGYFRELRLIEADFMLCKVAQTRLLPPAGWLDRVRHLLGFRRVAILCMEQERLTHADTVRRVVGSLWQNRHFWSAGGPVSELCRRVRRCQTVTEIAKCLDETHKRITD
jgi:hypothetical protein